jgi:hypothetical protein
MLVAVGGHSRNIGKTSVVAGLIRAVPEAGWTAVKITQFGHGVCSSEGEACQCQPATPEHPYALSEELDPSGQSDTCRFLAAGARRSYWLRTAAGQLGNALPALNSILQSSRNTIVESNSILQFFRPHLYLVVLDFAIEDFKPTSLEYLDRADALIVIERGKQQPRWSGVARKLWESKPRFCVTPPQYVTDAVAGLVRAQLKPSTVSPSDSGRTSTAPDPG